MPEVGVEPTLAGANTALNRARLPIPPLRHAGREGAKISIFEAGGRNPSCTPALPPMAQGQAPRSHTERLRATPERFGRNNKRAHATLLWRESAQRSPSGIRPPLRSATFAALVTRSQRARAPRSLRCQGPRNAPITRFSGADRGGAASRRPRRDSSGTSRSTRPTMG